jgi:hypothetical protein
MRRTFYLWQIGSSSLVARDFREREGAGEPLTGPLNHPTTGRVAQDGIPFAWPQSWMHRSPRILIPRPKSTLEPSIDSSRRSHPRWGSPRSWPALGTCTDPWGCIFWYTSHMVHRNGLWYVRHAPNFGCVTNTNRRKPLLTSIHWA